MSERPLIGPARQVDKSGAVMSTHVGAFTKGMALITPLIYASVLWLARSGIGEVRYWLVAAGFGTFFGLGIWVSLRYGFWIFPDGILVRNIREDWLPYADFASIESDSRSLYLGLSNGGSINLSYRTLGNGFECARAVIEGILRDNPNAKVEPSVCQRFGLPPFGLLPDGQAARARP
ncbi:MAG TPA: hypothetical protein VHN99_09930 [Deinococcales bacterium]|nr:hypothetical protein [Deinococcales bacterium]